MTIGAEVFPVRSVRGVVVVIAVFVMHRQEVSGLEVELSGAFCADQPVDLE